MAVAYQSDGGTVFANAANNTAVTVPLPATRPVGSLLLFIGWCRLISATITTPGGYTLLSTFTSGTASGGRIWVYGRICDGTESAPTLVTTGATGTTGDLAGACIFCYSGVDVSGGITSALYDGTPTTTDASGTTTCTYPALSISTSTAMLVRFLARFRDAADTFTFTATWNEREDLGSTNRTGGQFHLQDKLATASGSQASVTVAPSNTTAARYLAVTAALKAAAAATVERQAAFAATAALASAASFFSILERTAALAATGAIASVGTFLSIFQRSAALDAVGAVTSSGIVERPAVQRSAALAATATITSASQKVALRSSSLAATGGLATAASFYSILARASTLAASCLAHHRLRARPAPLPSPGRDRSHRQRLRAVAATHGEPERHGRSQRLGPDRRRSADARAERCSRRDRRLGLVGRCRRPGRPGA